MKPSLPVETQPETVIFHEIPQTPQYKKRTIIGGILGFVAAILFLITLAFATKHEFEPIGTGVDPTPSPAPERTERNYLLMGYGGGGHAGGKLTDTIMIVAIRPENKRITLISLPRDLWVPLPISEPASWWKLNAAYHIGSDDKNYKNKLQPYTGAQGGGLLASKIVSEVANLQLDGYLAVNFSTFTSTVDRVKGINVLVERTFDDYQYPIEGKEDDTCEKPQEELDAINATASAEQAEKLFVCRYEHLHFDKGINLMDGATALKYARSRHSAQDGNDFGRSERQKRVIIALKEKLIDVNFIPQLPGFAADIVGKIETNLNINTVLEMLEKREEYSSYEIHSAALTDKNVLISGRSSGGQYVLQPRAGEGNWTEIQAFIQEALTSTNSAQLATSSAKQK